MQRNHQLGLAALYFILTYCCPQVEFDLFKKKKKNRIVVFFIIFRAFVHG